MRSRVIPGAWSRNVSWYGFVDWLAASHFGNGILCNQNMKWATWSKKSGEELPYHVLKWTIMPVPFSVLPLTLSVSKNTWKLRYPVVLWKLYQSIQCYVLCFLHKSEITEMWFFCHLLIGDFHVRGDAWKWVALGTGISLRSELSVRHRFCVLGFGCSEGCLIQPPLPGPSCFISTKGNIESPLPAPGQPRPPSWGFRCGPGIVSVLVAKKN